MPVKKDYPRLRQQGPRYYYDHGGKPRKWTPLGKDWDVVLARYQALEGGKTKGDNTFGWLIGRFLASRSGLAANTMKSYRSSAECIGRVFASCPLTELRRGHVMDFIDRHPKKQMARNAVIFLKMVCIYGVERELLQANPLSGLKLDNKAKRGRYLTDGEFLAIRGKLNPVYQVAAASGYKQDARCMLFV